MKDIKNALLTKLFSILLAVSVVVFAVCTILTITLGGGKYEYKRVSAKITEKINQSDSIVLKYTINNGTRTEINLIQLSTKIYINDSYIGSFKVSFTGNIEARKDTYFECRLEKDLDVYHSIRNNPLSSIGYEVYETGVYFADYTSFDELNIKIGSNRS